jgi:hypothetical protein
MWRLIAGLFAAVLAASSCLAAELTPTELRWLQGLRPVVVFAQAARLPLDIVVQPQPTPGAAPLALGFIDGRCKLVLSMRGNAEAQATLERIEPELLDAALELMAARAGRRDHRHADHRAAEEGPAQRAGCAARARCAPTSRAWWAAPSRCASCRRARTWPRRPPGPHPISTRAAIEAMPEGCIAVVDAMGVTDAGIFGDILCARMAKRGVAGTGHRRRRARPGRRAGHRPAGVVPGHGGAALGGGLTFVGWQQPVGCGGVAVFPDDVIVADGDGAVLIPKALLAGGGRGRRRAGAPGGLDHARGRLRRALPGLYPPTMPPGGVSGLGGPPTLIGWETLLCPRTAPEHQLHALRLSANRRPVPAGKAATCRPDAAEPWPPGPRTPR